MAPLRSWKLPLGTLASRSDIIGFVLFVLANCAVVVGVYSKNANELLRIVVDPRVPDMGAMELGVVAYALHASAVIGLAVLLLYLTWDYWDRRKTGRRASDPPARSVPWAAGIGVVLIGAATVCAWVDIIVFRDYGIHFYEYDVLNLFTDWASARDLGIRRQDLYAAVGVCLALAGIELGLFAVMRLIGARLPGAVGLGGLVVLGLQPVVGLTMLSATRDDIVSDPREFSAALPLRGVFLLDPSRRPHVSVRVRRDEGGYPTATDQPRYPTLGRTPNIVFMMGDGIRADYASAESGLAPLLSEFRNHPDVLAPQVHLSTSHATEIGLFGLLYGLGGWDYYPFLEGHIPSFPLETLRANGYVIAGVWGSRILHYPSGQLLESFDENFLLDQDRDAFPVVDDFLAEREADGRPYFLMVFLYTPHYPFDLVEPHNMRFQPAFHGDTRSAFTPTGTEDVQTMFRNGMRNAVIQFDDYFGRTMERVRDDIDTGGTLLLVTSDHGTELWEHGLFGHGRSTWWKEQVRVPFALSLPGADLSGGRKSPSLTWHGDLWPTLLEYMDARPLPEATSYTDGASLLSRPLEDLAQRSDIAFAGRYWPWADRINLVQSQGHKYWFHAGPAEEAGQLSLVRARTTDEEDGPVNSDLAPDPGDALAAWEKRFWRFLEPASGGGS